MAATTSGALAAAPASTTTTPSSPTCTAMLPPAPVIMKTFGRTSNVSSAFDVAPLETCVAADVRSTASRWTTQTMAHTATANIRRPVRLDGGSITACLGAGSVASWGQVLNAYIFHGLTPLGVEAALSAADVRSFLSELPLGEVDEDGPVRRVGVRTGVLTERQIAVHHARLHFRELRRAESLLPEQAIDGSGTDAGQERALRVHPRVHDVHRLRLARAAVLLTAGIVGRHQLIRSVQVGQRPAAGAQEQWARRDHRDEFVRVNGQLIPAPAVLHEVARHPVVLVRGVEILDQLAELATMQFRATFTRRTHVADRKALVVGHRHERRLAPARMPFDADAPGVDRLVGFEIVHCAIRSPGERAQRSPVVHL